MPRGEWGRPRPSKYQPLVDDIAAQSEEAVTLSFTAIETIVGSPLSETMQVDASLWTSGEQAIVWRLAALGWRATLDRRNQCVHFTRDTGEAADARG